MKRKKVYFFVIPILALVIGAFGGYFAYTKIPVKQEPKDIAAQTTKNTNPIEDENSNNNSITQDVEAEQGLEEKLQKYDGQGNVGVSGSLVNPIEKNDEYIVIEAQFNTHSVNLDGYDFQKIASFKTSDGIQIEKEIIWEKEEGAGHHFLGKYKIPKVINGKPVITENTEFIELNIKNLDNVENRAFKWEKDIVKLLV